MSAWERIRQHAVNSDEAHQLGIDLYDADDDLTEDPDEAVRAELSCMSHDAAVFIVAIDPGDVADDEPTCRVCGCTDEKACEGGCTWVEDPEGMGDLCSACLDGVRAAADG